MPSENVLIDRRKKSRRAQTARIEGTGFRKGMAPDFEYEEGEPTIVNAFSEVMQKVLSSGDFKPFVTEGTEKVQKDAKTARKLFELQRQRVPGVFPEEKRYGKYDNRRSPRDFELLEGIVKDLKKRHPDLYNPYSKREVYEPFQY